MSDVQMATDAPIEVPEFEAVADRVVAEFDLVITKVAANHAAPAKYALPADAQSAEQLLAPQFAKLATSAKKAAATSALARVAAPLSARTARLGDLAAIDLTKAVAIKQQVDAMPVPPALKVNADHLPAKLRKANASAAGAAHGGAAPAAFAYLDVRLHNVLCVDETGVSWPGSDEIALGGVTIDPVGVTRKVGSFMVSSDFDNGERKVYNPPKVFATFSLKNLHYPVYASTTFLMAEKDGGGFAEFLNKVFETVHQRLNDAVKDALPSLIPEKVREFIAKAAGWTVKKIFEVLARLFGDDLFAPVSNVVLLESASDRWNGKNESPMIKLRFPGHSGLYIAEMSYLLRN